MAQDGIGVHEAHVWAAATARLESAGHLDSFAAVCSAEEEERRAEFVFARDRRAFVAAHGLLRLALSWCRPIVHPAAWSFRLGQYGRPEVAGPEKGLGLRFNLSHSAEWVACVVTRGLDCGIDVENVHRPNDQQALAARTLTPDEARELALAALEERPRRFIERWTLKEAFAKAIGLGLHLHFEHVGFVVGASGIRLVGAATTRVGADWLFEQWAPDDRHVAALAVRQRDAPVRVVRHHGACLGVSGHDLAKRVARRAGVRATSGAQ